MSGSLYILSAKTLTELKLALTPELNNLSCWLKANKLSLRIQTKTRKPPDQDKDYLPNVTMKKSELLTKLSR